MNKRHTVAELFIQEENIENSAYLMIRFYIHEHISFLSLGLSLRYVPVIFITVHVSRLPSHLLHAAL